MITANDFKEKYKSLSTQELLEILANSSDYQPLAVEIAQQELDARNLSAHDITEAKQGLIDKKQEKQAQKINGVENKIKNTASGLAEAINPIQKEKPATDKIITTISVICAIIFLYQFTSDFRMNILAISRIFESVFTFWSYLPLVIMPFAIVLFYKKKKIGWYLLTAVFTFNAIGVAASFTNSITHHAERITLLQSLFPDPPITTYIFQLFFLAATLYALCRPDMKAVFKVNRQQLWWTIVAAGLPWFLFFTGYIHL